MSKQDDAFAIIAVAAAAILGAAIIASLLAKSNPNEQRNPEYIREQLLR